jgi:hypothetical protein
LKILSIHHRQDLRLSYSDISFQGVILLAYFLVCGWDMYERQGSFCGDEGRDGYELAAGVGGGGGQPGSSAMACRSLTTDMLSGTRVSLGGEARRYA